MALQSSIAVQQAGSSGSEGAPKARVERVEITVLSQDSLIVNRARVSRQALHGLLQPLIAGCATGQVAILCKDGVTHGTFVGVLDEAKSCGASQIAVVRR
jgi:biopolymer transport protein ExbD